MGGITDEEDVLEFIMAGANAVTIGTTMFVYKSTIDKIISKLEEKMLDLNFASIKEVVGCINN